jgi:hypothetical protein
MDSRKQINEAEILAWLKEGDWNLPPLAVEEVEAPRETKGTGLDAIVTFGWCGRRFRFGAEVRRLWTPKAVTEAADQVSRNAETQKLSPLVVVPYLGEERLSELEARGVSGIDLCGNGVVVVPGRLLVFRSGSPNRFRWEGQIKNVYRGASAIVARVFLLGREFPSVGDALNEIRARGGEITLPTVSKVCKSLEADLVIERTRGGTTPARKLRLLQPEKLLDLLRNNYAPPEITRTLTGKFSGPAEALTKRLLAWEKEGGRKVVLTGASSVEAYAVMAREPTQTFYCSDTGQLKKALGEDFTETERFANLRLLETREEFVYFDRREGLVASPVQTYLELATGEKREKETADQVRRFILSQPSAKERKGRR